MMDLEGLLDERIGPVTKGWPARAGELPLRAVGRQGWSLLAEDLPLPVMLLKESALRHNSRWMRSFLQRFEVELYPHGKTTMAPQLFARQLADGAAGITVATAQQALVCRRFGVRHVLMANQLVGRRNIEAILAELAADSDFWFCCLVDSLENVAELIDAVRAVGWGRPLHVLVEGGPAGGRTGCRTLDQALEVARAIGAAPELALIGIEGYEGVIKRAGPEQTERDVRAFLSYLIELTRACLHENLVAPGPLLLSAGGSSFYDEVAKVFHGSSLGREVKIVLRSGCYLTHDSKMYQQVVDRMKVRTPEVKGLGEGLQPAIEVWASVQSTPEPGLSLATMGRRDVGFDAGLPVPQAWFRPGLHQRPQPLDDGFGVTALNDQHAFLKVPDDSPLRVGDMVGFGVSHPCTTFDRWRLLYVVDDDYRVTEAIRTFF